MSRHRADYQHYLASRTWARHFELFGKLTAAYFRAERKANGEPVGVQSRGSMDHSPADYSPTDHLIWGHEKLGIANDTDYEKGRFTSVANATVATWEKWCESKGIHRTTLYRHFLKLGWTTKEEQGTPNPFKIRDKVSTHGNGKAPNSLKIRDRVVSRSLKIKDTQSHRGAAV